MTAPVGARSHLVQGVARAVRHEGLGVVDRLLVKMEVSWRDGSAAPAVNLPATADWLQRLHGHLSAPWPCPLCAGFEDQVWRGITTRLSTSNPAWEHSHDGDHSLALVAWSTVRHLVPATVVETGVARGVTSAAVLSAMSENGMGQLYSIDLPPLRGAETVVGSAVEPMLRERWTYIRGSSRRQLPRLLRRLGSIDLFIHDSLHTQRNMDFEFASSWPRLRGGGVLISDDVEGNSAFHDLITRAGSSAWLVGEQKAKDRARFGVIMKEGS